MSTATLINNEPFRVGNFYVDPALNTVFMNEEAFRLEPRNMEVLCMLAEEPGKVVLRETIIDRLWGIGYGADESVTRSISVLRKTFREAGDEDVYIETLPKRGYRLLPPVLVSPDPAVAPDSVPSPAPQRPSDDIAAQGTWRFKWLFAAGAAFILSALTGVTALNSLSQKSEVVAEAPKDKEQQLVREQLVSLSAPEGQFEENSARVADREKAAYRMMQQDPETAAALANSGAEAGLKLLQDRAKTTTGTSARDWMNLGELTFENKPQISLAAYRAAAKVDPNRHEIWFRLSKLEEEQAGDLAAAMAAAHTAARTATTLLDRLVGLERLASLEAEIGDTQTAKQRFDQIVVLIRNKLNENKNNAIWLQELSVALDGLGTMEMRLGNIDEARRAFEEVLALDRRRAESDPSDWDNLRDISVSLENLGVLEMKANNLPAAKAAFEESMGIDRNNLRARPESLMISRDLVSSLTRVGEVNLALGNADLALSAYFEAEQITRLNLAKNPKSVFLKTDLMKCLNNSGKAYQALNKSDNARQNFKNALALARDLASGEHIDVTVRDELLDVLKNISAISENIAYQKEADLLLAQLPTTQ